jgi:hypothetical protein
MSNDEREATVSEPTKEFLRYGEARDWLRGEGISASEFRKLIAGKVIRPRPIRKGGRCYYFKSQIKTAVLNGAK